MITEDIRIPDATMKALLAAYPARRAKNKDGSPSDYCITMACRLQWPALAEAQRANPTAEPKFGVTLLIPRGADTSALMTLAGEAAAAKFGAGWANRGLRKPLRDQSEKKQFDGFEDMPGAMFFNATTKLVPACYGLGGGTDRIDNKSDALYAGCIVLAKVNVFAYDNQGNKGVSFGLQSVQKIADAPKLRTGSSDPGDEFGAVPAAIAAAGGVQAAGATADAGW